MATSRLPSDLSVGIAPPGYRLPASTRLGAVRLQVADLDRSLDWYGRVLGLRVAEQEAGRALLAAHGGAPLVELRERPGAAPVPRDGRLGLFHAALLLPDRPSLGAFLRHLADTGERAGASDHLVSEAIYLNDPDGLGIEVYADRPRDVWKVHERELVMDSRQLDAADLVRSAGNAVWHGLPAGTTMGHVHLHVGDLEEADAFYHQALGFDRVVWSYPGALFLSAGGYHHHLGLNTWSRGGHAGNEDARLLEWKLQLPSRADVDAAATSLEGEGHTIERADDGVRATDPWGTVVRITYASGPAR